MLRFIEMSQQFSLLTMRSEFLIHQRRYFIVNSSGLTPSISKVKRMRVIKNFYFKKEKKKDNDYILKIDLGQYETCLKKPKLSKKIQTEPIYLKLKDFTR